MPKSVPTPLTPAQANVMITRHTSAANAEARLYSRLRHAIDRGKVEAAEMDTPGSVRKAFDAETQACIAMMVTIDGPPLTPDEIRRIWLAAWADGLR